MRDVSEEETPSPIAKTTFSKQPERRNHHHKNNTGNNPNPDHHQSDPDKAQKKVPKKCKFGIRCRNRKCSFRHPDKDVHPPQSMEVNTNGDANVNVNLKKCKFGARCRNKATCTFQHPNKSSVIDIINNDTDTDTDSKIKNRNKNKKNNVKGKNSNDNKKNTMSGKDIQKSIPIHGHSHGHSIVSPNMSNIMNVSDYESKLIEKYRSYNERSDFNYQSKPGPVSVVDEAMEAIIQDLGLDGGLDLENEMKQQRLPNVKKKKCRWGSRCKTKKCHFDHPVCGFVNKHENVNTNVNVNVNDQDPIKPPIDLKRVTNILTKINRNSIKHILKKTFAQWKIYSCYQTKRLALIQALICKITCKLTTLQINLSFQKIKTFQPAPSHQATLLSKKRQQIGTVAKMKKQSLKQKKQLKFMQDLKREEHIRFQFWQKEQCHEMEFIEDVYRLAVAEFVRQNRHTMIARASQLSVEKFNAHEEAKEKIKQQCHSIYSLLCKDRLQKPITVVDHSKKDSLHDRNGTVQFWDNSKKKYQVCLATKNKKKNGELVFIKPEHLQPRTLTKNDKKIHPKQNNSNSSDPQLKYLFKVSNIFLQLDLQMELSLSDVKHLQNAKPHLNAYVDTLMTQRDEQERQRKLLSEEQRKLEEERQKRRLLQRQLMEEERKQKIEEELAWKRHQMAMRHEQQRQQRHQQQQEQQQARSSFYNNFGNFGQSDFFFGMGGAIPPFWFFEEEYESEEEYYDSKDDNEYYNSMNNFPRENLQEYAKLLGVDVDADLQQLKSAYKKKALMFHPDKYDPVKTGMTKQAAEEHFKEIGNAYESLGHNHRGD